MIIFKTDFNINIIPLDAAQAPYCVENSPRRKCERRPKDEMNSDGQYDEDPSFDIDDYLGKISLQKFY